jgi:hypothetical protein
MTSHSLDSRRFLPTTTDGLAKPKKSQGFRLYARRAPKTSLSLLSLFPLTTLSREIHELGSLLLSEQTVANIARATQRRFSPSNGSHHTIAPGSLRLQHPDQTDTAATDNAGRRDGPQRQRLDVRPQGEVAQAQEDVHVAPDLLSPTETIERD